MACNYRLDYEKLNYTGPGNQFCYLLYFSLRSFPAFQRVQSNAGSRTLKWWKEVISPKEVCRCKQKK